MPIFRAGERDAVEWQGKIDGGIARQQAAVYEGEHVKLANLPSSMTDWSTLSSSVHPGESGTATVRSRQLGDIQLRMVEYSASYLGDHWCHKGHLTFVISGQMVIEHLDGQPLSLPAGTSYHVADDDALHRVRSESGATVFVVD